FSKNGTDVGITAQATDPEGDPLTYTLSSNPNGLFAIDASTGKVTVADSGNLTEGSYKITVEASDGHLTSHSDFTIFVGEDHAPTAPVDIDVNSNANSVAEHAPIGTVVGITA